ncbi:hypothetical protein GOP47_0022827 [Adiantum capillus-veneris]|uniref:Uncharacterized protein n=1 Tax=Adiantum capillus-veneris TaxID=13818 RepID=A0A9D4Z4N6_ADICA|nr:hypothetical protein GOP47_0022827 [Adiantum capillus-veneris]
MQHAARGELSERRHATCLAELSLQESMDFFDFQRKHGGSPLGQSSPLKISRAIPPSCAPVKSYRMPIIFICLSLSMGTLTWHFKSFSKCGSMNLSQTNSHCVRTAWKR